MHTNCRKTPAAQVGGGIGQDGIAGRHPQHGWGWHRAGWKLEAAAAAEPGAGRKRVVVSKCCGFLHFGVPCVNRALSLWAVRSRHDLGEAMRAPGSRHSASGAFVHQGPAERGARLKGWLTAATVPAQVSASFLQRETLLRQLETNQLDIDATLEELSVQQETEDQNYDMYVGRGCPQRLDPAGGALRAGGTCALWARPPSELGCALSGPAA